MRAEEQQEWLHTRLAGTLPEDFEEGIRFCSTFDLLPPLDFARLWTVHTATSGEPDTSLILGLNTAEPAQRLLIFSDPSDPDQVATLSALVAALDALGKEAPPMLWAPHTRAPALRTEAEGSIDQDTVKVVMGAGLDGMILTESAGLALAMAVAARYKSLECLAESLADAIAQRKALRTEAQMLEEQVDTMLWDYLRVRFATCVPPMDYQLEDDGELNVQGITFGHLLGKGAFGRVYKVVDVASGSTEVVKIVDKACIKDMIALKCTKRMIEIMTLLSSEEWGHPNVTKLSRVYHAPNQILFRMEYSGQENLFKRLAARQKEDGEKRPLTCAQVCVIIHQVLTAVAHLHLGPKVAHRDVKPENFCVDERDGRMHVKILDFDLAIVPGENLCRTPCGTLPFTAPEVLLEGAYCGFAADVWSLGLVLLEIMCGVRVVETVFKLCVPNSRIWDEPANVTKAIYEGCQNPGDSLRILQQNARDDVRDLVEVVGEVIDGVVNVRVPERWRAEKFQQHLACFDGVDK